MVSLYIPAIAKLIQGRSAPEIFRLLRRHWYLTLHAGANRQDVIDVIQQAIDDYPRDPEEIAPGRELSREIVGALGRAGFLSMFARTWGMIGRSR